MSTSKVKKLSRFHAAAAHIDRCDSCCMDAWMGRKTHANVIGWMPTPLHSTYCPIALVCECPTCFTKWWTHYSNIPIPCDYLPAHVVRLIERTKRAA